ncbi:MAG: hypothetical protein ACLU4N_05850 [Butyricimonas faecihominis]
MGNPGNQNFDAYQAMKFTSIMELQNMLVQAIIDQFGNKDLIGNVRWIRIWGGYPQAESNPGDAGLLLQGYRSLISVDASVRGRGFH